MTKRGRKFQTECLPLETRTFAEERLFIMIYTQQVAEITYLSSLLLCRPISQHLFSVQLEITWFYNNLRSPIWTLCELQNPFIYSDQELFVYGSKDWFWYGDLHDSQRSSGHSCKQVDFFYSIFPGMILFRVVYFMTKYKPRNCPRPGEITLFAFWVLVACRSKLQPRNFQNI